MDGFIATHSVIITIYSSEQHILTVAAGGSGDETAHAVNEGRADFKSIMFKYEQEEQQIPDSHVF